jgi:hypothetical protein
MFRRGLFLQDFILIFSLAVHMVIAVHSSRNTNTNTVTLQLASNIN